MPSSLHHPLIGDIELRSDTLELPADALVLATYTAPLDSPGQEQLDFLASWTGERPRETRWTAHRVD